VRTIVCAATAFCLSAAPASAAEWVRHADSSLGFESSFVGVPNITSSVDDGVKYTMLSSFDMEGTMCMVAVGDYPSIASAAVELEANRDNFVGGMGATVTSNLSKTMPRGASNLPALEFDAENDKHRMKSLVVIDNLRVYQVAGVIYRTTGNPADLETCVRSFKLTM